MKTLIHTLKYFVGIDSPITQVSASELAILTRHARDARVLVEVGTYEGSTTKAIAQSTNGHVHTIDVFHTGRIGICYPEVIARHYCRYLHNVTIVKAASTDVASSFTEPIDLLFIDANHSYEAVKADCSAWLPKVRLGGVIALHDCKFTDRMPDPQGSWAFYETDIKEMRHLEELDSIESLVVLKKTAEH